MRAWLGTTFGHQCVLVAVCLAVMLPNLGTPSLWDVDEGVNAGCSREMREVDTWLIPVFNSELRTAKPVLLYWLQRVSYELFGVSEWAARFPAVLCGIGSVLITAALARRMFNPMTGLLAGLILATTIEFVKLSHAATPDAPLIFFVTLTMYWFWLGHEKESRAWFYTAPIPCALAILTKGPAYLGMIGLPILLYLIWSKQWRRLFDRRLIWGFLILLAIAVPWYAAVGAETKGAFLKQFIGVDNVGRLTEALEGHNGKPFYQGYYVVCILVFFMPWSAFLLGTFSMSIRQARSQNESANSYRLLLCWFFVILMIPSIMATKLPNYIATLYPALAILTANFLSRWRMNEISLPPWLMPLSAWIVTAIGVLIFVGLLITSGAIPISGVRTFPALAPYSGLGLVFTIGGLGMVIASRRDHRGAYLASLVMSTIVFIGLMAAFVTVAFDQYKASRELVKSIGLPIHDRQIALASFEYTQPSITFYAERKMQTLLTLDQVNLFLSKARPGYLFTTIESWKKLEPLLTERVTVIARRFEFTRNQEIVVIRNAAE